jgi:hypothetical protein
MKSPSKKRLGRGKLAGVLGAGLVAVIAGLAINAGTFLVVDVPERSDVILVLAGETEHRPAYALELLNQGYGGKVIIDVPAGAKTFGFTDAELAQKYIQNLPQAALVGTCAIDGLSTRDESHDAEKCLARELGSRVLIVTSDFHTRRALSIFRHEVKGKSFSVAASSDETQFGTRWWTHRQWAKTLLDEWLRLAWWNGIERWR